MKKLYRSRDNKIITGLIGGLGEYLDIDPPILRVVYIFFLFFGMFFFPAIAYLVASLIVPEEPHYLKGRQEEKGEDEKHKK